VSLGRALATLSEEKSKIKAPRSTKAKLDLVCQAIDDLERELALAQAREEQVRDWLVEASDLSRERESLQATIDRGATDLQAARYSLLEGILAQAEESAAKCAESRERAKALEWARDLPAGIESPLRQCEMNRRRCESG
jgi:hypothetical protein